MKKVIAISAILGGALLLAGCVGISQDQGDQASTTTTDDQAIKITETSTPAEATEGKIKRDAELDELIKITKFGERSENVRKLQTKLKALGLYPIAVTGYYGDYAKKGVAQYQAGIK